MPYRLVAAGWTLLLLGLVGWSASRSYQAQFRTATTVALDYFNKDLVYRRWMAKQGGVYVPITEETPPSPLLSTIPERDVTTPSGRRLTLVNPAFLTRQVHELGEIQNGIKAHITSLKPLRPENAPDAWEAAALGRFDEGRKEVVSLEEEDGAAFVRFMRPLVTEAACLKCHACQGYAEGDVSGGISVSVPWAPYREVLIGRVIFDSAVFLFVWSLGIAALVLWRRNLHQFLRERERVDQVLQSERDRAQSYAEKLQRSDRLLHRAQEIAHIGHFVLDPATGTIEASEEFFRIYGLGKQTLRFSDFAGAVHPDQRAFVVATMQTAIERSEGYAIEHSLRMGDGTRKYVKAVGEAVRSAPGEPLLLIGTVQDMTERMLAENAIQESREVFRRIFDDGPLPSALLDDTFTFVNANAAFARMLGYTLNELRERKLADITHPDDLAENIAQITRLKNGEMAQYQTEKRYRDKGGSTRWGLVTVSIIRGGDGEFRCYLAMVKDITEERHAVAALRQSEARYRRITESLTDYQYTVRVENSRACETRLSPACALVTGFTAEEFAADPHLWIRMIVPEDRALVTARVQMILGGRDIPPIEYRIQRKDGSTRWVSDTTILFRDDSGRLLSFDGVIKDITESRTAAEATRASEEKYRSLFEQSRDVIYISTREGSLVDINPSGVALLGYPSREALMAVAVPELCRDPGDHARLLFLLDNQEFVEDFKTVILRLDRSEVTISITATPVRDAAKKVVAIRGIIRDITENQRLEAQLRQSQKMESIGTLAGGVAHDFNNILTTISGYGHLALMKMAPSDPHRQSVQHILEAAERAAHLTGDLLLFSRKQPISRRLVDLNIGIRRLSTFLVRVIGEDIAFKEQLSGGAIPVLGDEHQISQVLMNLAANARDAMPEGGVFTISTETVLLDEKFMAEQSSGAPGLYGLITVADTGIGMDEQTRQRIFEPFFTTKDPGKGTGLGMAVVYGIVKQHDGLVTVFSEPGRGTTFRVYIPVVAAGAAVERVRIAQEQPAGGSETILLAEDDRAVREMTLLLLRDYGYTVITAVDGEDAVQKFKENGERIRLLLFDLIMPKRTGKDAYDEIQRLQPGIKVIFSSGYDPAMVRSQSLLEPRLPLIRKPVEIAALLKMIRSVLDSR